MAGDVLIGLWVLPRSECSLATLQLAVVNIESLEDRRGLAPAER